MIELIDVSKRFKIGNVKRSTLLSHITNISKTNKEIYALKNISLQIKDKESVAIIGPNGSGKSTLLRVISGILEPTKGIVNVDCKITSFLQLGIGFQPELSAKENVYLYGAILGKTRGYLTHKLSEILRFAELENFVNTPLKNFSSGMQSRLAFSTAINTNPETLVLDEVLAVGDLEFRRKCLEIFKKFKNKKTIVFVSHDLDLVKQFFDRCIYMKDGRIIADGKPEKVIGLYEKDSK